MWKGLAGAKDEAPVDVADELSRSAADIAAANLRIALECRDLARQFDQAGVPLLFVKGLTLGVLAYGESTSKTGVDIDLLIGEDRLDDAAVLLAERGYRPVGVGTTALRAWHRPQKESAWTRSDAPFQVDLHTRLADHRRLIPRLDVDAPRQMVSIAKSIALPTLADAELFAYLAVHGASSAWFRLKWITDFAAFAARFTPARLERLYDQSQELAAGRAPAQALLLADQVYGTLEQVPALADKLRRDPVNRWLAQAAMRQLAGRHQPVEPTSRPLGTAAIHYTQLLLLPGAGFALSEAIRQARAALR